MGNEASQAMEQSVVSLQDHIRQGISNSQSLAAATISYSQFVSSIAELNKLCQCYKDSRNCSLFFYVKKGTDATAFWKPSVRIGCVEVNARKEEVASFRILTLRQYMLVYQRIMKECNLHRDVETVPADRSTSLQSGNHPHPSVTPAQLIVSILGDPLLKGYEDSSPVNSQKTNDSNPGSSGLSRNLEDHNREKGTKSTKETMKPGEVVKSGKSMPEIEECCICLERKQDVILPCCHAYCSPCIEQWWLYCEQPTESEVLLHTFFDIPPCTEKSCPLCRKALASSDDTWVLSEAPDKDLIKEELRKIIFSGPPSTAVPETSGG